MQGLWKHQGHVATGTAVLFLGFKEAPNFESLNKSGQGTQCTVLLSFPLLMDGPSARTRTPRSQGQLSPHTASSSSSLGLQLYKMGPMIPALAAASGSYDRDSGPASPNRVTTGSSHFASLDLSFHIFKVGTNTVSGSQSSHLHYTGNANKVLNQQDAHTEFFGSVNC